MKTEARELERDETLAKFGRRERDEGEDAKQRRILSGRRRNDEETINPFNLPYSYRIKKEYH